MLRTYLSTASAPFRTFGSLSAIIEAIAGQALLGASIADTPLRFKIFSSSSSENCRLFATFDFNPYSSTVWKMRLYA